MHIRPFLETDENAVIALWQACNLLRPWNDPHKDIARKLQVQRELFLVGILDGKIMAAVMAGYEGHRGWINYLAVDPSKQRRGYGEQLIKHVEQQLLALGCPKINMQVRASNQSVVQFYRHLGFVQDEAISLGKRLIHDEQTENQPPQ